MATSTRLYEKWDMMPDNIRLEYMELIDVLNESELTTLAAKIISPIYMLKLLFNMLSTCAKWGAHTECAKYLKQFYDSKEEKNQDEIKLDPHAYFTQIYGGWGNFPVENMILMKEFYDNDKKKLKCLKEMVDNNNIEMMSLALRIRGKGERNRKILPDTLLPQCIIAMSTPWKSYFDDNGNGTSSGRKVVDERALAFTSLLEWGEKHYELAKQAYVLLSVEEQTDIQNSMDANGLTEERYLNYWQEKLTIGTMPVDTPEDIANKLEAVETLQKDDWLEALESTKQKPNQLLSLVELEDVKTGDNEKRKALKDLFESNLPICEKAFHDTFTDHSNVIPNMQTLSSYRDFQQKTNMVGIHISDVDLLSILFKVHPDLAGCPGKPQADSLKILHENRDILSEVICSATTSLFRRQKLLCSGLTMEVYLSNVYSLLIKHWDSTDAYEMEDTVADELFTVLTSIVSKENKKGFFGSDARESQRDRSQKCHECERGLVSESAYKNLRCDRQQRLLFECVGERIDKLHVSQGA